MKRIIFTLALCLPLFLMAQRKSHSKDVLMVVSSHGEKQGQVSPGYEFDEFSQAYLIFKANGFGIDVASPKGGAVEADKFNKNHPYNKKVLADKEAMSLLRNTKATASVRAKDYDAIFIVGGKGAMFDLPKDEALQNLIATMYERKRTVVAAVCHGPAAFVNVKLKNGEPMLKGQRVSGFSNEEEKVFGKKWVPQFPFLIEDKVNTLGATFESSAMMLPHITMSGKLLTGQNPYSTNLLATAVVQKLNLRPVTRRPFKDERTISLIKKALNGQMDWATTALNKNPEHYDFELVAVYGYYGILSAENNSSKLQTALTIASLADDHYFNEQMQITKAPAYAKLGKKTQAKQILNDLIAKDLVVEEAKKMLSEIN